MYDEESIPTGGYIYWVTHLESWLVGKALAEYIKFGEVKEKWSIVVEHTKVPVSYMISGSVIYLAEVFKEIKSG